MIPLCLCGEGTVIHHRGTELTQRLTEELRAHFSQIVVHEMRIALYGGTFDPVHNGHMAIAAGVAELFALDQVLFIPAHVAPHKRGALVTPALHRYAMLALATQAETRFRVSTAEVETPERPYTVDTLARIRAEVGEKSRLFFVMGADSWTEITTWRDWERVLALCNHIIVTRPGHQLSFDHVTSAVRERVVDLRDVREDRVVQTVNENLDPRVYITDAVMLDISATAVRHAARREGGVELTNLVPLPVAEYIKKYRLYREVHETESFNARNNPVSRHC